MLGLLARAASVEDFSICQVPSWRKPRDTTHTPSKDILQDMSQKLGTINSTISEDKRFSLFIDFVHQCNLGEDVGTQTVEETEEVLRAKSANNQHGGEEQKNRETLNTYKALEALDKLREEMDNTGMITVQQICDVHRVLLDGLHRNCGNIRETQVYTVTPDGERYDYTPPEIVESRLYDVVDRHNFHMHKFQELEATRLEKLTFLVKSAAWFLFHFVDTHPFSDGNGRMCRLLAGYTMMVLLPFPVHPYHTIGSNCENRRDYLDAIISCRRDPKHNPSLISALLVDAVHNCIISVY